jgi:hypothetical protein
VSTPQAYGRLGWELRQEPSAFNHHPDHHQHLIFLLGASLNGGRHGENTDGRFIYGPKPPSLGIGP